MGQRRKHSLYTCKRLNKLRKIDISGDATNSTAISDNSLCQSYDCNSMHDSSLLSCLAHNSIEICILK